ncbi:energy transducer TonB [Flavobacterium segetis]|uniref:energy transducer TonB n=1 Tax=Flavobacterium segetis TaxID=271157 RepID=UPI0009335E1A|nr:energy transducer TonB [Flavobacterium segetis]
MKKLFFPTYLHPEYPGGKKEFYTYLADTFKAPTNIKGQVIISFFVETDGTLNDFKIIKSINKEIDLAVIKVLVNALRWTPGQIDGVITRAKYTLPLTFQ